MFISKYSTWTSWVDTQPRVPRTTSALKSWNRTQFAKEWFCFDDLRSLLTIPLMGFFLSKDTISLNSDVSLELFLLREKPCLIQKDHQYLDEWWTAWRQRLEKNWQNQNDCISSSWSRFFLWEVFWKRGEDSVDRVVIRKIKRLIKAVVSRRGFSLELWHS